MNYANNDGVVWCVLTNGLRYRVFKTNEPVSMEQKLLFEVDLADEADPLSERLRMLRLLSKDAVQAGELDAFGERMFTDARVRAALADLASSPPADFVELIMQRLAHPQIAPDALHRSLLRVLDGVASQEPIPAPNPPAARALAGPAAPPKGKEYDLEHHLGNKSTLIRELWEAIDGYAGALGADVSRRVRKLYIGYFRGKRSFFTVETQKSRLLLYLALDPKAVEWRDQAMRDATNIGHFGMGDLEYSLASVDQLDEVRALLRSAYESSR